MLVAALMNCCFNYMNYWASKRPGCKTKARQSFGATVAMQRRLTVQSDGSRQERLPVAFHSGSEKNRMLCCL